MDARYAEQHAPEFHELLAVLADVPAVKTNDTPYGGFGSGRFEDGNWWVKFSIDIGHVLAWSVVQEFGCVLNLLSLDEPLPTVFKPVSPAPYMNGGPAEFLSWVIECTDREFTPSLAAQWLRARLPDPVTDLAAWPANQD